MDIYEENIYSKMFLGCIELTECPNFGKIEEPEPKQVTIDIPFDGFDWNEDSKRAFEE